MNNECMLTPWVDIRYLIVLIEVRIIITSERLLTGDWHNGSSEVLEIFSIFLFFPGWCYHGCTHMSKFIMIYTLKIDVFYNM